MAGGSYDVSRVVVRVNNIDQQLRTAERYKLRPHIRAQRPDVEQQQAALVLNLSHIKMPPHTPYEDPRCSKLQTPLGNLFRGA